MSQSKLLFLCTGNYYRSRFAEELFNHLAGQLGLQWEANSRGIARDLEFYGNPGPISANTRRAIAEIGFTPRNAERFPICAEAKDFQSYDRIIALSRDEHLPMMIQYFPEYVDSIEYWVVEDLHLWSADQAIKEIKLAVEALVAELNVPA